jgi:flagellar basal-body rod protein FlgB
MKKVLLSVISLLIISQEATAQTTKDLNDHLKYLAAREMIISQNLANIDTPGYKPKDLKKPGTPRESIAMTITQPGHIQMDQVMDYDIVAGDFVEIKPNGNAVTAEHELAKKNENSIKFSETSNIISAVKNMTKTAIKGGN